MVEATCEDIKGGFGQCDIPSEVHPNFICGTLDAIEAKFSIPVIYTSTVQDLATERAADALAYNGLVQSWPEIARLAREGEKSKVEQGGLVG